MQDLTPLLVFSLLVLKHSVGVRFRGQGHAKQALHQTGWPNSGYRRCVSEEPGLYFGLLTNSPVRLP